MKEGDTFLISVTGECDVRPISWATPLYKFVKYCNASPLEKRVLDCGAGGEQPPLQLFAAYGYETHGIEISGDALKHAQKFSKENNMKLNLLLGDMRQIPFKDEAFSFVYTYNAIHMMAKEDIALIMREIERVMKAKGFCFVNFVSADEPPPTGAIETRMGEFLNPTPWRGVKCPNIDSYFEDNEADVFFRNFEFIHKEKRRIERITEGKKLLQAYIDYIAQKK